MDRKWFNLVLSGILIVGSLAFYLHTGQKYRADLVVLPQFLFRLMAAMAGILLVHAAYHIAHREAESSPLISYPRVLGTIGVTAGALLAIPHLGFYTSTFFCVIGVIHIVEGIRIKPSRLFKNFVLVACGIALLYLALTVILGVTTPQGFFL